MTALPLILALKLLWGSRSLCSKVGFIDGRTVPNANVVVKIIQFLSSTVRESINGVRAKTISGATGSISGVTYKNITLSGITGYGVVVQKDDVSSSPTGAPTAEVPITGLTLDNVHGTVSGGQNVAVTGEAAKKTCAGVPTAASC